MNTEILEEKVNVATKSTTGHYVVNYKKIILLDRVKEAFFVEGEAELVTNNHHTLTLQKDCLIMPQQVYNPYSRSLERSKD